MKYVASTVFYILGSIVFAGIIASAPIRIMIGQPSKESPPAAVQCPETGGVAEPG